MITYLLIGTIVMFITEHTVMKYNEDPEFSFTMLNRFAGIVLWPIALLLMVGGFLIGFFGGD